MNALKTSLSLLATLGLGACSDNANSAKDVSTVAPQRTADTSATRTATAATPALESHKDVNCEAMLTAGDVGAICGVEVTMKSDQFFETKVDDFPCNRMFYPPARKKNFHEADEQVVSWTLQQWHTQKEASNQLSYWTDASLRRAEMMGGDEPSVGRTDEKPAAIGDSGFQGYQNGDPSNDEGSIAGYQYLYFSQDRELVRMESRSNCSPENMVALGKILSERLAKR